MTAMGGNQFAIHARGSGSSFILPDSLAGSRGGLVPNQLPEPVIELMEQFIRDITKLNCCVFGLIIQEKPKVAIGIMRNIAGSPTKLMDLMREVVQESEDTGCMEDRKVMREN